MREAWLYCPDLHPGRITLPESEGDHALRSLRLRPGGAVTLFDGTGGVARATLLDEPPAGAANRSGRSKHPRHRQSATVSVQQFQTIPPPLHTLALIVAGCKGARLDWLIEKGTELGVSRFILTHFERSIVRVGPHHVPKLERTALEACKQCQRAWRPRIEARTSLADALTSVAGDTLLIAHLDREAPSLARYLSAHESAAAHLAVIIGPEGGLSPEEVEHMRREGGHTVYLGEHILRVETAALAVAACWACTRLG